jgi:S1-C subfamily serine protease
MRRIVRAATALAGCMAIVGCANRSVGTGEAAQAATPITYRYVVVSPASDFIPDVAGAFVEKGYVVLRPEASRALSAITVPSGVVLTVSCTYLGYVNDVLKNGALVKCEAVDYASRKLVYSGYGEHTSLLGADHHVGGAVTNAMRKLPNTGRYGSISMVADFGRAVQARSSTPTEPPRLAAVSSGTGFFIDTLGDLITNAHVIDSCASIVANGVRLRVLHVDRRNDLALLRHPEVAAPVPLRGGRSIRPGEPVVVLGYPRAGLVTSQATVTTGTVSALAGVGDDTRFIQMSAPVQPGSSGGPVFDSRGSVVAVVVAKLNAMAVARLTGDIPENVNFALSQGTLRAFLDAHDVPYQTALSDRELSAADVAERTRGSLVRLECMR